MRYLNRSAAILALVAGASLSAPAQPSTVILVRHAEKTGPTGDVALSEAGTRRAKDLAAALADARVGSVITTQFQRTKLTGAVVAEAMKLTPIVVSAGSASHVADVAAAVRARPAGEVVLVVGHSNTVPAIVTALGGPKLPDLCDSQYSQMFILQLDGMNPPKVIRATYGAADPVDTACVNLMINKP
jgi:broad specificity phosphatase PhoE